ncbi:flavin-containing monooxygenase 5 [Aplysia californica]|uniref:Flavin-containing monooxygenase n=1 Tax=Aplysia californica TaxID=6500 RepID=A0ABM1AG44_APLCA|nr:flavin-containing monooxygenase 5 [Aplysia californica]
MWHYIFIGPLRAPRFPNNVVGMDTFPGLQEHSMTYRNNEKYRDKTVLVVGNKLSAIEIANDVANVAYQTYVAIGSGTWIIPRIASDGSILERAFTRKGLYSSSSIQEYCDIGVMREANARLDHAITGLRSDSLPFNGPWSVQDSIQVKILSGQVKVYGYLTEMRNTEAVFDDGQSVTSIDSVVYCTGYNQDYSFLDAETRRAAVPEEGGVELYKYTFPAAAHHNTIAFVGHYSGDNAMLPLVELQCRLATRVMAGKHKLPTPHMMKEDADAWNAISLSRKPSQRVPVIPFVYFAEELAKDLGVYPHFWTLFFKDPRLAYRTWAGPWFPASYRLLGPDSTWEEARRTCHQMFEEDLSMVCHRKVKPLPKQTSGKLCGWMRQGVLFPSLAIIMCYHLGYSDLLAELQLKIRWLHDLLS